ncbi:sugar nucleotide-binding protein [Streptomyces chartreusis]
MTVLIIGGSGFLGTELVRQAVAAGHQTAATFASRPGKPSGVAWRPLDVRDPARVARVIADVEPSVVLNVSSGQSDWAVTADGAIRVALAAAEQGCRLAHVSSDAVFSGAHVRYDESSLPDPVSPYGAAKAAAETAVRLLVPGAVVARTSLILRPRCRPWLTPASGTTVARDLFVPQQFEWELCLGLTRLSPALMVRRRSRSFAVVRRRCHAVRCSLAGRLMHHSCSGADPGTSSYPPERQRSLPRVGGPPRKGQYAEPFARGVMPSFFFSAARCSASAAACLASSSAARSRAASVSETIRLGFPELISSVS